MDCIGLRLLAGSNIRQFFGGDFFCPALVDGLPGLGSAPQNRTLQACSISEGVTARFRGSLCGVRTRGSLARTKQLRLLKLPVAPLASLAPRFGVALDRDSESKTQLQRSQCGVADVAVFVAHGRRPLVFFSKPTLLRSDARWAFRRDVQHWHKHACCLVRHVGDTHCLLFCLPSCGDGVRPNRGCVLRLCHLSGLPCAENKKEWVAAGVGFGHGILHGHKGDKYSPCFAVACFGLA